MEEIYSRKIIIMATEVRDMAYISDEILLAGILIERRVWMSAGCDDKQYV